MSDPGSRPEDDALAAVVRKPAAEAAIDALRAEGVYDEARKVRERDADTVEIPVTDPPAETTVRAVVEQADPERRRTDLDDHLRDREWAEGEIERAPSSWAVIGSVVLVTLDEACPRPGEVGEALLALHGEADTVLRNGGVSGEHREPSVSVLAGAGDTETVHTESGTRYALDLAEVMFSPGNKAERVRMGEAVSADERVFDMFAGIGYFALPMARAGADVVAAERNPAAFRYLLENAALNDVTDRLDAYRADCRDVAALFGESGVPRADRIVMGYYRAHEYLDDALGALADGGTLHLHEATPEDLLWDRPIERLESAAEDAGREVALLDRRRVKSHSEGVWHVVVDAEVA